MTAPDLLPQAPSVPEHTGSRGTRALGVAVLAALGMLALLGLVISPADAVQGDAARIMYVHVPSALAAYLAFGVTAVGSVGFLWKRSRFWDTVAAASAEVGVLFTGLTLVTGMIWGKPTWGVYWVWDARLTSTALLFILFLGYLAVRNLPADADVRARRAAVVGLVAFVNVPIVHYSVDWWRSLHQPATISRLDPEIDGLMLFTLMWGIATFVGLYGWLLLHRFRVQHLQDNLEAEGLDLALAERRAEAAAPASSVTVGPSAAPPAAPAGGVLEGANAASPSHVAGDDRRSGS